MEENSYISLTNWSSISDSWLFRQKAEVQLPNTGRLTVGFKLERKDLTKAYDIPGYWDAFSTVPMADPLGPHGFGGGIGHSLDSTYVLPPPPNPNMPPTNRTLTDDIGVVAHFEPIRQPSK